MKLWLILRRRMQRKDGKRLSMWCDCGNPRSFDKVVDVAYSLESAEAKRQHFEKFGASSGYHYMRQELEIRE